MEMNQRNLPNRHVSFTSEMRDKPKKITESRTPSSLSNIRQVSLGKTKTCGRFGTPVVLTKKITLSPTLTACICVQEKHLLLVIRHTSPHDTWPAEDNAIKKLPAVTKAAWKSAHTTGRRVFPPGSRGRAKASVSSAQSSCPRVKKEQKKKKGKKKITRKKNLRMYVYVCAASFHLF